MLIPRFELTQTNDVVTFVIRAPYANINQTEVIVEGSDFRFYSSPYYLRLNLPGDIVESDDLTKDCLYEDGIFTLKFLKVNKGEHFENLDMITSLLAPPKKKEKLVPTIEVISNPCAASSDEGNDESQKENDSDSEDSGDEWYITQNPEKETEISLLSFGYGFANKISGHLNEYLIKDIVDLPFLDKTSPEDRRKLREKNELEVFKMEESHYMFDYMSPEEYAVSSLEFKCEWEKITKKDVTFTDEEKDLLKELPNKEYLLDNTELKIVLNSMVDILFASCYTCRFTEGENNSESGWSINKLSPTLSWFEKFTDVKDVILSCIRRSLCFPLVRNWNYSMKVFEDVKQVIKLGRKYIIKRFCEIHSLFIIKSEDDPRYILNELYIKDYLIWLQQISESKIEEISELLENVNIKKEDVGFDLLEIEEACKLVENENFVIENDLCSLPDDLEKLLVGDAEELPNINFPSLKNEDSSDSDSDSSSSDSTSTDSSSSTTDSDSSYKSINSQKEIANNNDELDSDDEPN